MRRSYYYHRRMNRRLAVRIILLAAIILVVLLFGIATLQMRTLLSSLATARASSAVNRIVSEAVNEKIDSGEFAYDDLISFEKGQNGEITAVKSNMPEFNRLQSQILGLILERISEVSTRELSIPVGSLSGSSLLAGRGPLITVKMQSVGSSTAYLRNEFISAGINQTKHLIVLYVDVYISILLPGFSTATKVSNSFTVAETVIVGSVPESYTYFNSTSSSAEEEAKEYILNGN